MKRECNRTFSVDDRNSSNDYRFELTHANTSIDYPF